MEYQSIQVRPVTPTIGAEIYGVDLGGTISNQQFDDIHTALLKHVVIFFRDQKMTPEQQKDFGRRFGKLHIHPASPNLLDGHPEILLIKADQNSKRVAGEVWHSDVSCDPEPPMGSILYMLEPPSNGGGDTMFANMYAAYDALSEPMKRFLEGLTAIHDGEHVYRGRYQYTTDPNKVFPRAGHPVAPYAPGDRTQGAVRQPGLHDPNRRAERKRRPRAACHAVRPCRNAGVPVPVQVGTRVSGILG